MAEDISELSPAPRKRDASFYLVLFFFGGPIWSVVPMSWAYVIYSLSYYRFLSYTPGRQSLFAFALCEVGDDLRVARTL